MSEEKNKFHALQLFTDTFAAETVHLTNEQVGIYIRLLCFAWTKNAKPFTTESAYRICQCNNNDCINEVAKVLAEFFQSHEDNKWTHKRLVHEHEYLIAKYKKRSEAGKKGGLARSKNVAPIPIPSPSPNKYNNGFSEIWDKLCIKRGSKFKAHQIYLKVHDEIDGIQHHIAEIFNKQMKGIEDKFVPHFSTWLSQKRWEDYQNQDESITIKQKMEKLGYVFRHTESNFDYFKKDGIEYKIDKYDKDHIIHKVE